METVNSIFTTVIIRDNDVTTAVHFTFKEAKDTLINLLKNSFNEQTDDAMIFLNQKEGESFALFNYRAYLSGQETEDLPVGKENKHVKIFFTCPRCKSNDGRIKADEDGDVLMVCKDCQTPELVF